MKKSTLFISAALTTFMLAIMFGVASAYQKIVQASVPTEVVAQQSQPTDVVMPTAANTAVSVFTAEQAANLASDVIGRTDLYSAEIAQRDGVDAYLITFSSGDIVYVSMDGQVLSISKIPSTVILAPPSGGNRNGGNGGNGGSYNDNGNSNGNSNDSDDHDDNDDDHGNDNGGGDEGGDD
jgi:hypothetical protein